MANVFDVAAYILRELGPLTTMKLQKLVYYAQAWSLVWDEEPLFPERIEAWANGPVAPALYEEHRGQFKVAKLGRGRPSNLSLDQKETVDGVLSYYGKRSAHWLITLTHMEPPWRSARKGVAPGEPCCAEISLDSMADYYSGLVKNGQKGRSKKS